ncbi:MAG: hypothetical protein QOJ39_3349 [Candidatus Eremiobacteraeota bacterium]|jgi:hypothetical protein|nr:hypothetical protein [Candidatus Eremiobacteraeota bacterium]
MVVCRDAVVRTIGTAGIQSEVSGETPEGGAVADMIARIVRLLSRRGVTAVWHSGATQFCYPSWRTILMPLALGPLTCQKPAWRNMRRPANHAEPPAPRALRSERAAG